MHVVVLVTTPDVKEAERIGQTLLGKRLAACVNIMPSIRSRFWWRGQIERCDETLIIIKSKSEVFDEIVESVRAIHSYEVPEILALPVKDGFSEYLAWIDDAVKRRGHQEKSG